jgi:hypothetical protein
MVCTLEALRKTLLVCLRYLATAGAWYLLAGPSARAMWGAVTIFIRGMGKAF